MERKNNINRLIIIGNGFDIAHGLKTSYKDFIDWYLFKAFKSLINDLKQVDDLFINFQFKVTINRNNLPNIDCNNWKQLFTDYKSQHFISLRFKSLFFKTIYEEYSNKDWIDVEKEYYDLLYAIYTKKSISKSKNPTIEELNRDLTYFKQKLREYLKEQEKKSIDDFDKNVYQKLFNEPLYTCDFSMLNLSKDRFELGNVMFLNFNYTNTLQKLYNIKNGNTESLVHIHSCLNNDDFILGFGDELDKKYKEIEEDLTNEYLENVKSTQYPKNRNYFEMVRFIEQGDFQVQIYGHSCGLSDRTMFNQILEHKNCKSIKVFYYENEKRENDFSDKIYNLYRHFTNKVEARSKIVPFPECEKMPQIKELKTSQE